MTITTSLAAQSYAATRPITAPDAQAGGNTIQDKLRNFAQTMQDAEATAVEAVVTGSDPHALVEALAQTELAVETAVTIRDKVVEAYQEILRMPI